MKLPLEEFRVNPAAQSADRPVEITWSILHPSKLDAANMRAIVAAAQAYRVDSFEVCGEAHTSLGSLDGAIRFRDYPAAAARLDLAARDQNIRALQEIAKLAHASGRPVVYWHREVMVPREIVESVPGLLDETGEFDLLGGAYHDLLRSKIREFFDAVPQMDGLVLTVTESDYSVIHNSNPTRYPPAQVVAQVITTFAAELRRLKKRFVLRSFGSVPQDYEDILAGANAVDTQFAFEVETKITPFDFSPFLPFNRYLQCTGRFTRSAEYDSIGEFLGAGFLPAADPERVIASVRFAQDCGVDRHTIRVDRIGHATFDSPQAINLLAFDRAIREPGVTADEIWRQWAARHWPDCPAEMTAVMRRGIDVVKKCQFIDGHVIFHAFPIDPTWKWLQACGILSVFRPGISLSRHQGMWGILPERTTPTRAALLAEKDEAVRLADESLRALDTLAAQLPAAEERLARATWENAVIVTRLIREWCRCVCAYFDDIEGRETQHPNLSRAVTVAKVEFERALPGCTTTAAVTTKTSAETHGHEYGDHDEVEDSLARAYVRPLWCLIELLEPQFHGELAERNTWRGQPGVIDSVVCGGLADDHRIIRYMHASHARLERGHPVRFAGNRVFPNGFIECRLEAPAQGSCRLVITGDPTQSDGFHLWINGHDREAVYDAQGHFETELSPAPPAGALRAVVVRILKSGARYPAIRTIATLRPTG